MELPNWVREALGPKGGQIAIIVLAIPVIYLFGFREMRFFLVPSGSMEPTLLTGDHLMTLSEHEYKRGDVVVLEDPEERGAYIVKRIVGVGGDTVTVNGGGLFVNGQYISEPYIQSPPDYSMDPITIPENHVFLLGDNRNNSEDSHAWKDKGLDVHPDVRQIVGKVLFIYYPYDRAGNVRGRFMAVDTKTAERQ